MSPAVSATSVFVSTHRDSEPATVTVNKGHRKGRGRKKTKKKRKKWKQSTRHPNSAPGPFCKANRESGRAPGLERAAARLGGAGARGPAHGADPGPRATARHTPHRWPRDPAPHTPARCPGRPGFTCTQRQVPPRPSPARTFCSFLFRRAPRCQRSGRAQAELRRGPPPRPQARARRGRRTGGEGGRAPPAPLCASPRPGTACTPRRRPPPRPRPPRTYLRAARPALASCRLASCTSAAARGSPASLAEPRAPPIRPHSPGLAPCRPLIGARGRPLGVRHAGRAGRARKTEGARQGRKEAGRRGQGRGPSGARAGAGRRLPPPARPAASAANQRTGSPGCEHRVGVLESEGRRRLLIGPAFPVEREARRGRVGWHARGCA